MADWLQTRREVMCLNAVERFGPVCITAINALTGMPTPYISRHLRDMEVRGRVSSYHGYDHRSCTDDVLLWIIPEERPRVGWWGEALILFCGDEPPSIMEADDAFLLEEGDL